MPKDKILEDIRSGKGLPPLQPAKMQEDRGNFFLDGLGFIAEIFDWLRDAVIHLLGGYTWMDRQRWMILYEASHPKPKLVKSSEFVQLSTLVGKTDQERAEIINDCRNKAAAFLGVRLVDQGLARRSSYIDSVSNCIIESYSVWAQEEEE